MHSWRRGWRGGRAGASGSSTTGRGWTVSASLALTSLARQTRPPASRAGPLEWNIYIESVGDLKKSIRASSELNGAQKAAVLFKDLPRFVWRATAEIDQHKVLELFFDATDISQGSLAAAAIEYDGELGVLIRSALGDQRVRSALHPELLWRVLRVFE